MTDKNPRRPMILYMACAAAIIFLINLYVYPALLTQSITEVDYSDFLSLAESETITEVTLKDTHIYFTARDSEGALQ